MDGSTGTGIQILSQTCKAGRDVFRRYVTALCEYALDGKALLLFVGYQGIAQGKAVTIPKEVLCKAIQIKDCRAEAFCGWWSKVYGRFEKISSVTGRISAACKL